MGRRPISFGHISRGSTSQERRNLILGLFTERGASHLRARCARCDHTSGELQPALRRPLLRHHASPTSWLGAILACLLLLSASLRCGLKMPFSSTSFCSILLCRCAKVFRLRRHAENSGRCQHTARISVVRGSTRRSFALLEGFSLQGALCTQT